MFYRHLRKMSAERGFPQDENERPGVPIDELVECAVKRNADRNVPFVDLWIAILDECIGWFVSLNSVVYGDRLQEEPFSDFEKAVTLVVNKIIADSTAMRHLILLGFDTSARTILRSVSEYMEVLVAMLHSPDFARDFVKSDTPETAQEFWEKHLRGGKIRRKINAAWNDFLRDGHQELAVWLTNWGRSSNVILSGLAHPSFAGGVFATIPLKANYSDENWLGIWGDKAEISASTVSIYTHFMFPILVLGKNFPFQCCSEHIRRTYDEANEFHRQTHVGRGILASIILSANGEGSQKYVFPELDLSIFPDDTKAPSRAEQTAS